MARLISRLDHFIVCVSLALAISCRARGSTPPVKTPFFIFGDSIVDAGNNNYIDTVVEMKANYRPYGESWYLGIPTGRFSNGRLVVDFIAEYAGLPVIPPFLQPGADFIYGVNFASGGAGVLPETHEGLAIDLPTQVKNFDVVHKAFAERFGDEIAKELISEAVYFISIGSNDYLGGYLLDDQEVQEDYSAEQYVDMVIGNLTKTIQVLHEKGCRKFAFLSLSPLGCIPVLRSLNPNSTTSEGGCFKEGCALAQAHNEALKIVLQNLEQQLEGFIYSNSNLYDSFLDLINYPANYGFEDGIDACCGSGTFGGTFTCGKAPQYLLCDNVEKHVWWDSYHTTQALNAQVADALWKGTLASVGPYNIQELFNAKQKLIINAGEVHYPAGRLRFHY